MSARATSPSGLVTPNQEPPFMREVMSQTEGVKAKPWSWASLPLLLLLSFAISVGLGFYALATLRSVLVHEQGSDLGRTAAAVADTIDRVLFERFGDIQVIANDAILQDGSVKDKTTRLREYKQLYSYYSWIGATDAAGTIIAVTDPPAAQHGAPVKSLTVKDGKVVDRQDWFESVRRTGQVYFGDPRPSPESGGAMAVAFAAPIHGTHGEFRGAVGSLVPLNNLRTIIDKEAGVQFGREPHEWLMVDPQGRVISDKNQTDSTQTNLLTLPSVASAATDRQKPGYVEELDARRQVPVVTGYARTRGYENFPGFDWTILMRVDHDRIYAPINHLVTMVGGIGLLVLTPLTGFGVWASWKLIQEDRALIRTSQALEQSVAELTRSNADLQQFAYVASHDLQEPLRMVASYTQLLAKRYKGKLDTDADEFISYAVEGANRMQQLIKDLLAYSRVTTQRTAYEPTECTPALAAALNNLHMAIQKQQAAVTHDPLPTVVADSTQLTQLFQNLISNAIKFRGDQPPRVHLSAVRKENEWVFAVRDNGIGVDPQYADRIFVIFQRLHTSADYPGTGIGLALCKKIVERHGGRIWVDSHPGQGATFYFTLPFSPNHLIQEIAHHDGETH
jgi:signal transduction histidine kinase